MKIAGLDDDPVQTRFVNETLSAAGFECCEYSEGQALVDDLGRQEFDLLVLDWGVPGISGEDVLKWVRQSLSPWLPIMFMTSRAGDDDIVTILNAGADDYVVKPVPASVLLARICALARCRNQRDSKVIKEVFDSFEFDLQTERLRIDGEQVTLTKKEFALALLLFRYIGQPLSREHITDTVWHKTDDVPSRTLDTHISALRSKLRLRPGNGYVLLPIYGVGYRLERVESSGAETHR